MASVARYCCCGDPCVQCDPTGAGLAPKNGTFSGWADAPGGFCASVQFSNPWVYVLRQSTSDYCNWIWSNGSADITLYFSKQAHTTTAFGACNKTFAEGDWYLRAGVQFICGTTDWLEKTTGFACSGGRVSGSHTFGLMCSACGACNDSPTFTVPA